MKYKPPQPQSYSAETAALITQLKDRIKRLEEAGDEAIHEANHGREYDALEIWNKAKGSQ